MENKFKKIPITSDNFKKFANKELNIEELDKITGGKNNADKYYDYEFFCKWYDWVIDTYWYGRCPKCGAYMGRSLDKYSNEQWWWSYYYNKLVCLDCRSIHDELY